MPFAIKDWKDAPDVTTPISAAALEDLEARLSGYVDDTFGAVASDADLAAHEADTTAVHGIADTAALATDAELAAAVAAIPSDAAAATAALRSLGSTGNKALPGTYLDTDATLAADSDSKVASQKATKAFVATASGLLVPKSLVDAKGDLLAGSAADTVARLAAGTDGQVLESRASEATGLKWVAVADLAVPVVSALPGSPVDGQVVRYQSAAMEALGIVWVFRYRSGAAGSYKWEFVGGGEWTSEVAASEATASTSYANLTTTGPTITVPLAGDYILSHGALLYNDTVSATVWMSYAVGGAAAIDADAVQFASSFAYQYTSGSSVRRRNALAAATALTAKYKASAGNAFAERRFMAVRPVRVG